MQIAPVLHWIDEQGEFKEPVDRLHGLHQVQ